MIKKSRIFIPILSVLILNLSAFVLPACKAKSKGADGKVGEVGVSALILFKIGDVKLNEKPVEVGDIVRGGFEIKVGPKSLCDLQIKEPDVVLTLRVKAETVVVLSASSMGNRTIMKPEVRVGRILVRAGKLGADQELEVIGQTAMASVRGTDFEMAVTKNGGGSVTVVRGKVAVRPRLPGLENLPVEVLAKSKGLRKLLAAVGKQEVVLAPGGYLPVDRNYGTRILKAVPGLKKLLENPAIKAVVGKKKADPAAIAAAVKALESGLTAGDLAGKVGTAVKEDLGKNPLKPVILKDKDLKEKLKEYEDLISMKREKLRSAKDPKAAVAEFNKKRRESLMKRITEIMGKEKMTILLKDGTKVTGVRVDTKSGDYMILTPEGTKRYTRAQVDGVVF